MMGSDILDRFIDAILNPLILLIFSVGFLVFLWGLVQFLRSGANPDDKNGGKEHMIWGVIGMFIMIAAQGFISLIQNTFNF